MKIIRLTISIFLLMILRPGMAQFDQVQEMQRQNQYLGMHQPIPKAAKAQKEKFKQGYIVTLTNDTLECALSVTKDKYFIEDNNESLEIVAASVKSISYLDINEGNVVLYSLPFQRNGTVEGHFFRLSYRDKDFVLVKNDEKFIEELICKDERDYLRGHYFFNLNSQQLIPVSKKNFFLLAGDFEQEVKRYVEQEKIRLKTEWDFIEAILYYKYLKYPDSE